MSQCSATTSFAGRRSVTMTVRLQTGFMSTQRQYFAPYLTPTHGFSSPLVQECPKCRATIEKNGGCNHMVCSTCRCEYCWVCLGPWAPHGASWWATLYNTPCHKLHLYACVCIFRYNCNRFNEKESKDARDLQTVSFWYLSLNSVDSTFSTALASSSGKISFLLQSLHEPSEESADGAQG